MKSELRSEILTALAKSAARLEQVAAEVRADPLSVHAGLSQLAHEGLVRACKVYPAGWKPQRADETNDHGRVVWRLAAAPAEGLESLLPMPPPAAPRRPLEPPRGAKPHKDARPEPIEILARMAGRSTFRTPKQPGASTAVPVTPLDIAHAIATVPDKLGAAMAMAIACQRPYEWPRVERLGHARVLNHLSVQHDFSGVVDAPYTYRARIALYDAFHDMIVPEHRRNLGTAAKDARMPRAMYRWLLRETCGYLEAAANTAAADACRYLFSNHVDAARERGEDIRITIDPEGFVSLEAEPAADVERLCRDVLARPRRPGLLAMKR